MNLKIVHANDEAAAKVIDYLEQALERAKESQIIGVTVIEENREGCYTIGGPSSMNRLQTAGALFDAAVSRLGYINKDT